MFTRKVVAVSAAAFTLVALSVPVVNAQGDAAAPDGAGAGSIPLGSLESAGLGAGSLADGSADVDGDDDEGDDGGGSSVGDLTPETDAVCELPALGGSVAKFYPLFGIDGVPAGVIDLVTTALDAFPNLLDVVAGEGGGTASLAQTGSFAEGLCGTFLGGEMVLPPVTVIVDGDGSPVSTVTGTTTPSGSTVASTLTAASGAAEDPVAEGSGATGAGAHEAEAAGVSALAPVPTSVPVP
ncbi:hypothetical protein JTP68_15900 [Dietzia cinnamea]|uniref:hypothetical protein n=1 Tax=Dietzia cinnamea TaxID=321318 RepID=UPI001956D03D|nr:hypothetical protein [Dietzia cinnamea]MBM7231960.1 hypothetical protein [Dietzia cinnamea]MCT2057461.1 hypothetical protein [Dietzia cinnamea]